MRVGLCPAISTQNKMNLPFALYHQVSVEETILRAEELRTYNPKSCVVAVLLQRVRMSSNHG